MENKSKIIHQSKTESRSHPKITTQVQRTPSEIIDIFHWMPLTGISCPQITQIDEDFFLKVMN